MKKKISKGGDLEAFQSKINEWLKTEGINLTHHITHANNGSMMIITVLWGA
jgi:hypothetical protein